MKRMGLLIPRIGTWDNIALAYHKAAAGKVRAPSIRAFAAELTSELNALVREIIEGRWEPAAYQRLVVHDP